ncbi:tyrosine-type recombinase/integrase [Mycobacterium kiyosense]|nr:hypothetical protein IWGMT90018_27170 [Mycobacterium kiyosense]
MHNSLTKPTTTVLRLRQEAGTAASSPAFPTQRTTPMSADAVQRLVTKHAAAAAHTCPSIAAKRVTPHTLRHTAAMALLHAGIDTSVIALWLGHQSPVKLIYLHADTVKERKRPEPRQRTEHHPGRYRPADDLINFLQHS